MTLNDLFLKKPRVPQEVWLTTSCYPQNIQRTTASVVNDLKVEGGPVSAGPSEEKDQTACKPGSVPPRPEGRNATVIPLDRPSRDGSRDLPGPLRATTPLPSCEGAQSLFGLAPGGACHAVPVTSDAVGSYPTLSPFPLTPILRWAGEEVCFLWRYPWGRPRRALPAAMSSWSPDFPRPPCESRDRPAV